MFQIWQNHSAQFCQYHLYVSLPVKVCESYVRRFVYLEHELNPAQFKGFAHHGAQFVGLWVTEPLLQIFSEEKFKVKVVGIIILSLNQLI